MTREEFQQRINDDYHKAVDRVIKNKPPIEIVRNAYQLACYNEINDLICDSDLFFDSMMDDDWLEEFEMPEKVNMVEAVYDDWLDYSNPERYNFFNWEDLIDICRSAWNI